MFIFGDHESERFAEHEEPPVTNRYLKIYLRDHLALGLAGVDFCQRVMRQNRDNLIAETLKPFADDLEEEARALTRLMARLDVDPSQLKVTGARLAVRAGKLKLNGELLTYSPLSRLFEIESLLGAVQTRKGLWKTLSDATHLYPDLDDVPMQRYLHRIDGQIELLEDLHQKAARTMLKRGRQREISRDRPSAP